MGCNRYGRRCGYSSPVVADAIVRLSLGWSQMYRTWASSLSELEGENLKRKEWITCKFSILVNSHLHCICQDLHIPLLSRIWSFFTSSMWRKCFHWGFPRTPLDSKDIDIETDRFRVSITFKSDYIITWNICHFLVLQSHIDCQNVRACVITLILPTNLHSTVSLWKRLASDMSTAMALLSLAPNLNFLRLFSEREKS